MQKVKMIAQGRFKGLAFAGGVYSLALEIGGITGRVWNNDDGTVGILHRQSLVAKCQIHPRNSQRSYAFLRM